MAISFGAGISLSGAGMQVGVPLSAPIITQAQATGTSTAVIAYIPPVNTTGVPITSYSITQSPANTTQTVNANTGSTFLYSGLTQGSSSTFTLYAYNAFGASAPAVVTITEWDVPQPPTSVTATLLSISTASVTFSPPVNFGGTPTIYYSVISSPGSITSTGTATTILVSGLTSGTTYTFTAIATNIVGNSLASTASNSVVAALVPGAPTGIIASALSTSSVSVAFTAASSNGSTITSYTAISSPVSYTHLTLPTNREV